MQHVRTRVVLKRSRDVAGPFRTPSSLNSAQSEASGLYKSAHFAWALNGFQASDLSVLPGSDCFENGSESGEV
jgi:hypothetical protein